MKVKVKDKSCKAREINSSLPELRKAHDPNSENKERWPTEEELHIKGREESEFIYFPIPNYYFFVPLLREWSLNDSRTEFDFSRLNEFLGMKTTLNRDGNIRGGRKSLWR